MGTLCLCMKEDTLWVFNTMHLLFCHEGNTVKALNLMLLHAHPPSCQEEKDTTNLLQGKASVIICVVLSQHD